VHGRPESPASIPAANPNPVAGDAGDDVVTRQHDNLIAQVEHEALALVVPLLIAHTRGRSANEFATARSGY
jgi:hypothetical protein